MGAYNVKASTDEGSSREQTTKTEPPKDKDKGIKKETKKNDDNDKMEEKTTNLKKPLDDEQYLEEKIAGNDERSDEVKVTTHKRPVDNEDMEDKTSGVQEKTKKKAEKRNTEETVMAARERYLARKRMKQET